MDVHASLDELPELNALMGSFQVRFQSPERAEALSRYITGLLTEPLYKNCDAIAQAVPGTSAQHLQASFTTVQWDEEDLNRRWVQKMSAEAALGDGVLALDDTGFPGQGKASVGVARQYCRLAACSSATALFRASTTHAVSITILLFERARSSSSYRLSPIISNLPASANSGDGAYGGVHFHSAISVQPRGRKLAR